MLGLFWIRSLLRSYVLVNEYGIKLVLDLILQIYSAIAIFNDLFVCIFQYNKDYSSCDSSGYGCAGGSPSSHGGSTY